VLLLLLLLLHLAHGHAPHITYTSIKEQLASEFYARLLLLLLLLHMELLLLLLHVELLLLLLLHMDHLLLLLLACGHASRTIWTTHTPSCRQGLWHTPSPAAAAAVA
jgi:hypothetical protein